MKTTLFLIISMTFAFGQTQVWETLDGKKKAMRAVKTNGKFVEFAIQGRTVGSIRIDLLTPACQSNVYRTVTFEPDGQNVPRALNRFNDGPNQNSLFDVDAAKHIWRKMHLQKFQTTLLSDEAAFARKLFLECGTDKRKLQQFESQLKRMKGSPVR